MADFPDCVNVGNKSDRKQKRPLTPKLEKVKYLIETYSACSATGKAKNNAADPK